MRKFRSAISVITVLCIVLSLLCSCGKKKYAGINISFMDFGKADAILITTENHTVLIDAANKGDGKVIYEYCTAMERSSIDYFIVTHFDKDHVGGAKAVINKFESIENIIQPNYEETNSEYEKYVTAMEEKGITPQIMTEQLSFTLDDAVFTVYPALEERYSETNNYSLAVTVEYGESSILFAGDAEKLRIKELTGQIPQQKNGFDLVKMPHHGVAEKNTDDFVEYFSPLKAVITCSEKEPADEKTLKILEENGTETYTTSDGTASFFCDGYSVQKTEQQ